MKKELEEGDKENEEQTWMGWRMEEGRKEYKERKYIGSEGRSNQSKSKQYWENKLCFLKAVIVANGINKYVTNSCNIRNNCHYLVILSDCLGNQYLVLHAC
jgi:hypothetical protein